MKNIIVGKVKGVQVVTVENEEGYHNIICKLQDIPGMAEEIAELKADKLKLIQMLTMAIDVPSGVIIPEGKAVKEMAAELLAKLNQPETK